MNILKEERKQKKLSQIELATNIGVSQQTYSKWENNKNIPSLVKFDELCDFLKLSNKKRQILMRQFRSN